jgi:hypothetical protein
VPGGGSAKLKGQLMPAFRSGTHIIILAAADRSYIVQRSIHWGSMPPGAVQDAVVGLRVVVFADSVVLRC